jgi:integrase
MKLRAGSLFGRAGFAGTVRSPDRRASRDVADDLSPGQRHLRRARPDLARLNYDAQSNQACQKNGRARHPASGGPQPGATTPAGFVRIARSAAGTIGTRFPLNQGLRKILRYEMFDKGRPVVRRRGFRIAAEPGQGKKEFMNRPHLVLTEEQASALLQGTWGRWGMRDRQMLSFLLHTGLKIREFVNLNVGDVFSGKRVRMTLTIPASPGREARRIPLDREAREAVAIMLEFNRRHGFSLAPDQALVISRQRNRREGSYRITPRQVQRILKTLREEAALGFKTTPQTLRHTFAASLIRQGADLRRVQMLLGHRSIKTTRHLYGGAAPAPAETNA